MKNTSPLGTNNPPSKQANWIAVFVIFVCLFIVAIQILFLYRHDWQMASSITQIIIATSGLFLAFIQAFPTLFNQRILPKLHIRLKWEYIGICLSGLLAFGALIADLQNVPIVSSPHSSVMLANTPSPVITPTVISSPSPVITPTIISSPSPQPGTLLAGQHLYNQIVLGKTPDWSDNLDDPSNPNSWSNSTGPQTGCLFQQQPQDQKDYYYAYSYASGYVTSCFSNQSVTNFAYQVHMTVRSGDGGGIVFRSASADYNSSMYRFDLRPQTRTFDILVQTDNANHTNRPCNNKGDAYCYSSVVNLTGENTLAVIAVKSILYFYINGTCVATVTDTTSSSGFIGVFAVDSTRSTNVAFDSAQLWENIVL